FRLAARREICADEQEPGQLALRTGRGLERDRIQTRHLREDLLQPPHQLERALRSFFVLERMQASETRERSEALVDPRVVFHRAGAEWIEAGVDAEVARRELREVANELELRHLGKARRLGAAEVVRDLRRWGQALVARQRRRTTPRLRLLVDEPHPATSARTSASRSISSGVRRSVTATSRTSSNPS